MVAGGFGCRATSGAGEPNETVLITTPGGLDDDYEDMCLVKY